MPETSVYLIEGKEMYFTRPNMARDHVHAEELLAWRLKALWEARSQNERKMTFTEFIQIELEKILGEIEYELHLLDIKDVKGFEGFDFFV